MNMLPFRMYRLSPRGSGGVACDETGIALGRADLVCLRVDATGQRICETAPLGTLSNIVTAAYGPQSEDVVHRIHRGLSRAAFALEAGDLCLAGIETVLLGLPDLSPQALERLSETAELEKWGTSWQNQPRVPAGQPDGGQWTTEDGANGTPTTDRGSAERSAEQPASDTKPKLPLDDGVYRPQSDAPRVTLTGGPEDDDSSRRSNGPPDDFKTLEDVFPGLRDSPELAIPLAPIDGFLGVSALADEANLEATMAQYQSLVAEIKEIDPSFVDSELLPPGGIEGLTWEGRANLIDGLLMQRAVAYYQVLGDVGPLQVETLRFLQKAVDAAYADAVSMADTGRLQPRLSREEAIGNQVDREVRDELNNFFSSYGIAFGPGADVNINNRDYQTSPNSIRYRVPDARISDVTYDWSLSAKTITWPQVRGFFAADSQPRAVVIVRPTQLGPNSTYLIRRPADRPL